jgi:hypothetical protein
MGTAAGYRVQVAPRDHAHALIVHLCGHRQVLGDGCRGRFAEFGKQLLTAPGLGQSSIGVLERSCLRLRYERGRSGGSG